MSTDLDVLTALLDRPDGDASRSYLKQAPVRTPARTMRRLGRADLLTVIELLEEDRAGEVVVLPDADVRAELFEHLPRGRAVRLCALLDPDDRAWLCPKLPSELAKELLDGLDLEKCELTRPPMAYRSARSSMRPACGLLPHRSGDPRDRLTADP